jgi:membrane protease YdiL (CAAX protease family)
MPEEAPSQRSGRPVIEVLAVAAGMVVFALFSHRGLPWILVGATGLLVAAASIERSLRRAPRVAALLGLGGFSGKTALFAVLGCAIGAGGGLLHRRTLGLPLLPAGGLGVFAAMACLIGATEELVYRGWLQGRLQTLGWPVAVVVVAAAHAAYKSALFAWPPGPAQIDCAAMAGWTFVGGVVLGLLRQISDSVVPPIVAHAVFDLLVYGALVRAPWWVWG